MRYEDIYYKHAHTLQATAWRFCWDNYDNTMADKENDTIQEHSAAYHELRSHNSVVSYRPIVHTDFGRRLVKRSNGRSLLNHSGVPGIGVLGVLKDGFTTLINLQLYWIVLFFCSLYILSWLGFAFLWWGTVVAYGPIGEMNISCVENVRNFQTAFLFSLETEVTIGYGYRYIRSECGVGIFILVVQCIAGLFIDSLLLGLVFAKITRPRNRRKTILFSDRAVIYNKNIIKLEDDQVQTVPQRVLEFRIADIRISQLAEAHVRLQLYWNKKEEKNGNAELQIYDLDVGYDTGRDRIVLLTPVTVTHVITPLSPLAIITEENLPSQDLEIVVILEGIVEGTGLTAQALWSFTQKEIFFNYKFVPMVYRQSTGNHKWEVNFKSISHTMAVDNNH